MTRLRAYKPSRKFYRWQYKWDWYLGDEMALNGISQLIRHSFKRIFLQEYLHRNDVYQIYQNWSVNDYSPSNLGI